MAYITEQLIRKRFADERQIRQSNTRYFSATDIITEGRQIGDSVKTYDIFLSHSSNDNELIAGLKLLLQDMGYSIYVDWNDSALNPTTLHQRQLMSYVSVWHNAEVSSMHSQRTLPIQNGCLGNLDISML